MSTKIKGRYAIQMSSNDLFEIAQGTGRTAAKARRELERRAALTANNKPEKPQTPRKKAA